MALHRYDGTVGDGRQGEGGAGALPLARTRAVQRYMAVTFPLYDRQLVADPRGAPRRFSCVNIFQRVSGAKNEASRRHWLLPGAVCRHGLADDRPDGGSDDHHNSYTATPIKHLVVIFKREHLLRPLFRHLPERAETIPHETPFKASRRTPSNNNLVTPLDVDNGFVPLAGVDLHPTTIQTAIPSRAGAPNNGSQNGAGASNPFRLSPAQAVINDQGHNYTPEQEAYNNGLLDGFPAWTGVAGPPPNPPPAAVATKGLVMGYYDGNTTTALWNYAQHFAMSDNHFTTTFGPSTPGALNLIAGQNSGFSAFNSHVPSSHQVSDGGGSFTMIGDGDPLYDTCSNPAVNQATIAGRNIGDLLNAQGITWGWFEGGFDLTVVNPNGTTGCARSNAATQPPFPVSQDYIPHHQPFQYFASTRNPTHVRPISVAAIGHSLIPQTNNPDPANHQYDTARLLRRARGRQPAAVGDVFLKAPAFQDGHAGYSNPIDEQHFVVGPSTRSSRASLWAEHRGRHRV